MSDTTDAEAAAIDGCIQALRPIAPRNLAPHDYNADIGKRAGIRRVLLYLADRHGVDPAPPSDGTVRIVTSHGPETY